MVTEISILGSVNAANLGGFSGLYIGHLGMLTPKRAR
jgi:hypothetical protein